jgi:hypothetical protein
MSACWQPGDAVVWRSRLYGRVGYVLPANVVVDTPAFTVLYQAPGSVCKRAAGHRGGPHGRNLIAAAWDGAHEDRVWPGPPTLRLHRHGSAYAIIRRWNPAAECAEGWYLNLEAPWRRTPLGFDSEDLTLDITVADDRSSWAWKDADELAWQVEAGRYTPAQAAAIWDAGRQAIAELEAKAWPFTVDWAAWRPDPSWPIPTAPTGWNCEAWHA